MMQALNQHLAVLRTVLQRMFVSPLAGLLNILVIGIALSLPAGMYVLLQGAQNLASQLSGAPQISLFLAMDAKTDDIDHLREQLAQGGSFQLKEIHALGTARGRVRHRRISDRLDHGGFKRPGPHTGDGIHSGCSSTGRCTADSRR